MLDLVRLPNLLYRTPPATRGTRPPRQPRKCTPLFSHATPRRIAFAYRLSHARASGVFGMRLSGGTVRSYESRHASGPAIHACMHACCGLMRANQASDGLAQPPAPCVPKILVDWPDSIHHSPSLLSYSLLRTTNTICFPGNGTCVRLDWMGLDAGRNTKFSYIGSWGIIEKQAWAGSRWRITRRNLGIAMEWSGV